MTSRIKITTPISIMGDVSVEGQDVTADLPDTAIGHAEAILAVFLLLAYVRKYNVAPEQRQAFEANEALFNFIAGAVITAAYNRLNIPLDDPDQLDQNDVDLSGEELN